MRGFIELSRVGVAPVAGPSQACRTHKHTGPEADCASDRRLVVRPPLAGARRAFRAHGLPVPPARQGPSLPLPIPIPIPLPHASIPRPVPVDSPALPP